MNFHQEHGECFVPDGGTPEAALARTTHLAVGAHQDDLEILAADAILACYADPQCAFTGIVVTDGRNSPRTGPYAEHDGDAMGALRREEQRNAARIGRYGAVVQLDYPSSRVKEGDGAVVGELEALFALSRPRTVYTHNLADKHDTHVAVTLRVLEALRRLDPEQRPEKVYGCEVWRDLDWLCGNDKIALPVTGREALQAALLAAFDSQVEGGKRYDLAVLGRRRAHATFHESHAVDGAVGGLCFAMDLRPLLEDGAPSPAAFASAAIERFRDDVVGRIARFTPRR